MYLRLRWFAVVLLGFALGVRAQTLPVVVSSSTSCSTSTDGTVVGLPNPSGSPVVAVQYTGSLGAANYYVEVAWYGDSGVTLASAEVQQQLTMSGGLQVSPPVSGVPQGATGMNVYIGTASGGEQYQGQTTGAATFIQSTPLVSNPPPSSTNSTVCSQIANDAGWPTGTGYNVTLVDSNGNTLPGYPMQWQLLGPGTSLSLNQGLPRYNGSVIYPVPIMANPYNHAPQSISGALSLSGYPLTQLGKVGIGTGLPGWGVDAEAVGTNTLLGVINAGQGFLVNGIAGTAGTCLTSDGSYYDSFVACLTKAYQTVAVNGTPLAQETELNLIPAAGSGVAIGCVDESPANRTDCTFTGQGDMASGTVASASGTATTAYTFTTAFTSTPVCTAAPYSSSGAWYFSTLPSTASTGIITYASSGAQTFSVICVGPGGAW